MNIQSINIFNKGITKSLGTLEAAIMEVLWNADSKPQSARTVTNALKPTHEVSFNAVSTVLNRLEKKDLVSRVASGKRYSFKPSMSKKEYSYSILSLGLSSLLGDTTLLSAAGISGGSNTELDSANAMKLLEEFLQNHHNES